LSSAAPPPGKRRHREYYMFRIEMGMSPLQWHRRRQGGDGGART